MEDAQKQTGGGRLYGMVVALLAVLNLVFAHREIKWDGGARYDALTALLTIGHLQPIRYSYFGPLLSTPLWLIGAVLGSPENACVYFNLLVLLLALARIFRVIRRETSQPFAFLLFVLLLTTSTLPVATLDFYGDLLSAVLSALGILEISFGRRRAGWACLALAALNSPAYLVPLLLVAGYEFWKTRRWLDLTMGPALAVALILLERVIKFGSPLISGYEEYPSMKTLMPFSGQIGFSYPFALGLISILFSFGKGLLFFMPGLVLVPRIFRDPMPKEITAMIPLFRRSLLFLAGLVIVYSKWWAWYGGWAWGPRLFVFAAVPASYALAMGMLSARTWAQKSFALALAAFSMWVCFCGISFGLEGLDACSEANFQKEVLCWYVPEFSPIFRPLALGHSWGSGEFARAALMLGILGALAYRFILKAPRSEVP